MVMNWLYDKTWDSSLRFVVGEAIFSPEFSSMLAICAENRPVSNSPFPTLRPVLPITRVKTKD